VLVVGAGGNATGINFFIFEVVAKRLGRGRASNLWGIWEFACINVHGMETLGNAAPPTHVDDADFC
jgi:hypothetical protein